MEYFFNYFLFMTLCLSFSDASSSDDALEERASMYKGYKVFTVRISTEKDIRILRNMENKYQDAMQVWADDFVKGDFVTFHVKMDYVKKVTNMLKRNSMAFTVHRVDMEQTIRKETKKSRDDRYQEFGYNYAKHNTFRAMFNLLKGLTSKYCRISRLEVAGGTIENRPVLAVHISKTRSRRKPAILIECGIHAREWSAFEVCIYFISEITRTYSFTLNRGVYMGYLMIDVSKSYLYSQSIRELLKQKTGKVKKITSMYDFVIMPALNPDGYVYTWTKDRMWRKNRSCDLPKERCVGNCIGVDVNRNFDVNFCSDSDGSKQPCMETYCGKSAFSERESRAVKHMITKLKNRLLAYFCFHSFMSVWTFPWAKTNELPRNYRELERVAKVATTTIRKMSNTTYRIGSAANVIYSVSGSSMDYSIDVGRAKYAYAVELRQGKKRKTGFIMDEDEIIPLCQETFAALVNSILAMRLNRN